MSETKVGIGVLIKKNNKVLLGKRIHGTTENAWCFPGGHLEFFESVIDGAQREVLEETGLSVSDLNLVAYTDDLYKNTNQHFVTIVLTTTTFDGEPQLKEPDKFEEWNWFSWDDLPTPLAEPMKQLLLNKFNPFLE